MQRRPEVAEGSQAMFDQVPEVFQYLNRIRGIHGVLHQAIVGFTDTHQPQNMREGAKGEGRPFGDTYLDFRIANGRWSGGDLMEHRDFIPDELRPAEPRVLGRNEIGFGEIDWRNQDRRQAPGLKTART